MKLTDPAKIKAATTYNAAADNFDAGPLGFWDRYGRKTVTRLNLSRGARVLDAACGTGASALPAAETVGSEGSVIAVDLAEKLLALGRGTASDRALPNVEFIERDMTASGYPDGHFDAVVCVFGVFFVPNMEALVGELWRMVKPRGKLAITTWGPRIFEPMYSRWNEAVRSERPDLYAAFNPWDRITQPQAVRKLFNDAGIPAVEIVAESGKQQLSTPDDWWTIVLGSGLRWTVEQLGAAAADRVRDHNLSWARSNSVKLVETNVIYAVATKPAAEQ